MPTQKESPATGVSTYITPRFHRRGTPACPDQSPTTKICKTNPISPAADLWKTKKCETNPIYPPNNPKIRNEPNFRIPSVPPTPISAKRTQFTPTPAWPTIQICETNPISYRWRLPGFPNPKMRNEPNSTRRIYETNPICPTPTICRPKNTKRTQFPARRTKY